MSVSKGAFGQLDSVFGSLHTLIIWMWKTTCFKEENGHPIGATIRFHDELRECRLI